MIRRRALLAASLGGTVATILRPAWARDAQLQHLSLTLLVGAAPDSGPDQQARAFAPFLLRHLPRSDLTLVNLPGEGGLHAMRHLASAPDDGSVIGWVSTPALPARAVDRDGGFLFQRLALIGAAQKEPVAIVTPADTPLTEIEALFRHGPDDADAPLGTPQPGSSAHLAALRLQHLARKPLNILPFPSVAAARQAVLAGNVAAAALALGDVIGEVRDGSLTCFGLAAAERVPFLPDTPVLAELGVKLEAPILRGLAAPSGLPVAIASRLRAALQAVVADPEFGSAADTAGFQPDWLDGADWRLRAEQEAHELAALWHAAPWAGLGAG